MKCKRQTIGGGFFPRRAGAMLAGVMLACWLGTGVSQARQDETKAPPATDQPATEDIDAQKPRTIEEIRKELERDDPVGRPEATGPMPESLEFDPLLPPVGRLRPEGSFLVAQRGYLSWSEELGATHFVPETDQTNPKRKPAPLILLPSQTTERIEKRVSEQGSIGPVRMSGRVYVFKDRNYIVPTSMPFRSTTPIAPLKEGLRLEGVYLANRAARISRSDTGGQWIVTFESDASGMQDPPMFLSPCRLLERILRVAQTEGDSAKVIISGQVFTYHDANYLLPTVFLRPAQSENLSP